MSRLSGRVLWSVAALAIVVAAAQVAEAQREGGRRGRGFGGRFGGFGGFGPSRVQLAAADEVQAALNLTDEQKGKVEELSDQLREDLRDLRGGGGGFRENMEEMQKLNQEAAAKLAEVLDENQQKRLMGIQIQVNGASSLFDAEISKELAVTEDQKAKLDEIRQENMESTRDAMEELRDQDASFEDMQDKMRELRTDGDKKLLAALTTDQQTQYDELKGDPVEIDMSQFRGRGFGGRGGGGRGDGRGRNRDRDNDNDNSV